MLNGVQRCLVQHGHDVEWSRNVVGQAAEDPLVAATAMELDRVLVSHDNDMKRIQRFISDKHQARFPRLSRVMFQCAQAETVDRLRTHMAQIQFEYEQARIAGAPLTVIIQKTRFVICR